MITVVHCQVDYILLLADIFIATAFIPWFIFEAKASTIRNIRNHDLKIVAMNKFPKPVFWAQLRCQSEIGNEGSYVVRFVLNVISIHPAKRSGTTR